MDPFEIVVKPTELFSEKCTDMRYVCVYIYIYIYIYI
jgi:hypothetical protein